MMRKLQKTFILQGKLGVLAVGIDCAERLLL